MDPAKTPPRGDGVDEPEMPLSDRMAKFQEELRGARGLLDKVTPGYPKLMAPVTIAEAFDLADAAQAAKAKENVSVSPCSSRSSPTNVSPFPLDVFTSVVCFVFRGGRRTHRIVVAHQNAKFWEKKKKPPRETKKKKNDF